MNRRVMMMGTAAAAVLVLPLMALARGGSADALALSPVSTAVDDAAGNPTAAVDPRGGAGFVAWIAGRGKAFDVFVARVGADGGIGPAVRANHRPGDAAPHGQAPAQVAAGPDGAVYVVWQNNVHVPGRRFPASDLRLARSADGGRTFASAVTVNGDAGGRPSSHTFHDVVVGADGTVWVSWLDGRVRDSVRATRPRPPAPSIGGMGHGGHVKESDLPGTEIRVARSVDGGRTFTEIVVDQGSCPCCRTSLAVGPDGTMYVAWRKVFDGDVRDVVVASLAPGAARFGAPVRVHDDRWVFPACPHAGPSVAVDARGRVHVGWYTGVEGRRGLWYARSDDGARTFGAATSLAADVPPSQVALSAAGGGVLAAWDDRGKTPRVAMARVSERGRMERVESVPGRLPALDFAAGRGLVAWHDRQAVRFARVTAHE